MIKDNTLKENQFITPGNFEQLIPGDVVLLATNFNGWKDCEVSIVSNKGVFVKDKEGIEHITFVPFDKNVFKNQYLFERDHRLILVKFSSLPRPVIEKKKSFFSYLLSWIK